MTFATIVQRWHKRALQGRLLYCHNPICSFAPLFQHVWRSLRLAILIGFLVRTARIGGRTICRELRITKRNRPNFWSRDMTLKASIVGNIKLENEVLTFLVCTKTLLEKYEKDIQNIQSGIMVIENTAIDRCKSLHMSPGDYTLYYKQWWSVKSSFSLPRHFRNSPEKTFHCERSSSDASTMRRRLTFTSCSTHKILKRCV